MNANQASHLLKVSGAHIHNIARRMNIGTRRTAGQRCFVDFQPKDIEILRAELARLASCPIALKFSAKGADPTPEEIEQRAEEARGMFAESRGRNWSTTTVGRCEICRALLTERPCRACVLTGRITAPVELAPMRELTQAERAQLATIERIKRTETAGCEE